MNKFLMAAIGGTLAGAILVSQVAGPLVAQEADRKKSTYEQLDLFGDIFERIRSQYVEDVDTSELIEAAIDGMLTSLDPHSSYLSPDDALAMRVQTRGEFGGLGIEVTQEEGFVKVVSPMDGTPADEAGMLAGDFICTVSTCVGCRASWRGPSGGCGLVGWVGLDWILLDFRKLLMALTNFSPRLCTIRKTFLSSLKLPLWFLRGFPQICSMLLLALSLPGVVIINFEWRRVNFLRRIHRNVYFAI